VRRKLAAFAIAGALAAGASFAFGGPNHPCNAGSGNGSEPSTLHDCDPGNSGGNNQGGD
jgi:hypothetical protein